MTILIIASIIILSYLFGSIPFGLLIGRKFTGLDVTQYGSGKTGATNVLRTAGKKAALIVGLLDVLKGALPVILIGIILKDHPIILADVDLGVVVLQVLAGLAAIAGHTFSVFLKFHGGRGVATFFGSMVALCPIAGLFGVEVLIIATILTRFVSFGSITGATGTYAILIPLTIFYGFNPFILVYSLIGAIFIILMHRDNIVRLLSGTERRLGQKAEKLETVPNI